MGQISDAFGSTFRDYETDGLPSSGPHDVRKADAQALGGLIETSIATIAAGITRFATVVAMNAAPGTTAGQLAYVYANNGSPNDGANGYYQWDGAAWVAAPWVLAALSTTLGPRINRAGVHPATVVANTPNDWTFTFPAGTDVQNNDWIRFRAPATPTAELVVHMPEGVPQNFWNQGYSRIGAGGMVAGQIYIMERIVNGGGSHYRIVMAPDQLLADAQPQVFYGTASVPAGTNDVDVTTTNRAGQVIFPVGTPFVVQTGADASTAGNNLRIRVNGYIWYETSAPGATPYTASLPPYSVLFFVWAGGAGNRFLLVSINGTAVGGGGTSGDPLDANIAAIRTTLSATPQGSTTYARGVPTRVPNVFNEVDEGSSVGRGEGSYTDPAKGPNLANAPGKRMSESVAAFFPGNYTVVQEQKSVNGSFDHEFLGQFQGRTLNPVHLSTLTLGMNTASRFGQHSIGRNFSLNAVASCGDAIVAAGGIPVLIDCPEPHPVGFVAAGGTNGPQTWIEPTPTYNVTNTIVVDAANKQLQISFRDYEPFGGTKLSVGSVLRIASGPNAGDHTITQFLNDGASVIIGAGTLSQSETASRQVLHIVQPNEWERLLDPPPSKSFVNNVVRFAGGPPMIQNATYDSYNKGIAAIAARKRWPLIRWSIAAQRWIAARGVPTLQWNPATGQITGDPGGYTPAFTTYTPDDSTNNPVLQFNHPANAMRTGALLPLLQQFAYDLATGADIRGAVYGD